MLASYADNALLDLVLGNVTYVRPAVVFLELFVSGAPTGSLAGVPLVVGAGYAGRLAISNNSIVFPAARHGAKYNGESLPFGTPKGASWGAAVGVGLYDALTGGNLLAYFELDAPVLTKAGAFVVLPPGALYLKFSGGWSTALADSVLDHVLGGPDYVPPPTWFYGLLANGAELSDLGYARQPAPNNLLNFPTAVAGIKANGVTITFGPAGADWAVSTEYALYPAPTAGVASMVAALATPQPLLTADSTLFIPGDFAFSLD